MGNSPGAIGTTPVRMGGASNQLNITAATLVKAGPGRIGRVNVIVAGSAAGSVNDAATIVGAAAANQLFAIPNAIGTYHLDMPVGNGIVITPGTGQTVAINYD